MFRRLFWIGAMCLLSCGGTAPPTGTSLATPPTEDDTAGWSQPGSSPIEPLPSAKVSSPSPTTASGAGPATPEPVAVTVKSAFPPPGFPAMHKRTGTDQDGVWERVVTGIQRTSVHPDKYKKFVYVNLFAIDPTVLRLNLVAGIHEPVSELVKEGRTGLIPVSDHAKAIAVFNGGFKTRHGGYGMMTDGQVFVSPNDTGCVLLLGTAHGYAIGPWPQVKAHLTKARAYRQGPPCLLKGGVPDPRMSQGRAAKKWGVAADGKLDIRRSAIGLYESGADPSEPAHRSSPLVVALGDWTTPQQLAAALAHAGIRDAVQMDINWSYTRFYLMKPNAAGAVGPRESLVPEIKGSSNRYVRKGAERDFFYLTTAAQP